MHYGDLTLGSHAHHSFVVFFFTSFSFVKIFTLCILGTGQYPSVYYPWSLLSHSVPSRHFYFLLLVSTRRLLDLLLKIVDLSAVATLSALLFCFAFP